MGATAKQVIDIALAEVGYLEKKSNKQLDDKTANAGKNNYTKYARDLDKISGFYNGKKNGYAWCDIFIDWCFVQAFGADEGRKLLCQPKKSYGAGCGYSAGYYKKKGQFYKKNPKPGDQIFFYNSKKTSVAHTGLVYDVDDKYVYTVEGNTSSSSGVVANGGAVEKKKYKLSYGRIYGYGRPKYDTEEVQQEEKPVVETVITKPNIDADYNEAKAGTYKVTAKSGLRLRTGASTSKKTIEVMKKGTKVTCEGYYKGSWLYVVSASGKVGFCSSTYLKKV